MKVNKLISALLILLALFTGVLSVVLCAYAVTQKPVLVSEPEEASAAAEKVMEAVKQGDFAAASASMQGKPDLGVSREPADTVGRLLWKEFIDSFSYERKGGCYATDSGMALDMTVTYLDFDSVVGTLGDRTGKLLAQRVKAADDPDQIYDGDNNYRQELVDEVLQEAAAASLQEDSRMVTEELTVQLVYEDGCWWVVPDTALIHVISGGTAG